MSLFHHLRQSRRRQWHRQSTGRGYEGERHGGRHRRPGYDLGTRNNGKLRTAGFRAALQEGGIKECALEQMQNYTANETFKYTQDMLTANPNMKGMFIETDQPTMGALRAIKAARREGSVLVAGFDGIPEFVELLKQGQIVASGMQQPYLMGVRSGEALLKHIKGEQVEKQILVPILIVTSKNVDELLPTIKETVFANEMK